MGGNVQPVGSMENGRYSMMMRAISFPTEIKLYKSMVLSILLTGCKSCTLTADLERQIQAFKNNCYRKRLGISYREHKTNEYVWQEVNILAG